jgi:hypothetical protein
MTGAKMQPEFNQNVDRQAGVRYDNPPTGGAVQDELRSEESSRNEQGPAADKVTDKFSDNAGDNALTRYEVNRSIVSPEVTNEHSFIKALTKNSK